MSKLEIDIYKWLTINLVVVIFKVIGAIFGVNISIGALPYLLGHFEEKDMVDFL